MNHFLAARLRYIKFIRALARAVHILPMPLRLRMRLSSFDLQCSSNLFRTRMRLLTREMDTSFSAR